MSDASTTSEQVEYKETRTDEVSKVLKNTDTEYIEAGEKTIILHATLPNGFEVVTSASCVDPDDYDADIGQRICLDRLRDRVYELVGFQKHPPL